MEEMRARTKHYAETGNLLTDLAQAGQTAAWATLQAEILSLAARLPSHGPQLAGAEAEARRLADEARVEASFDNMPV